MASPTRVRTDSLDMLDPANVVGAAPAARDVDSRLVLAGVLLVSAAYVWWHLGQGWMPFDDGTLAQSAERVMHGQLSHRDFDDVYTGGLAWLNAAAFRLLGTNLWSLRLVLFAVFLAWVPAVYYIASRFVRPLVAASVVLVAVTWSLPNYSAAMPSWYNLFLATFGVAALFRYLEAGHRRWLTAAGLAGGLSFLVKVIGLYYVAGVLLFLVFHTHERSRSTADAGAERGRGYAIVVSAALLLFVAALYAIVRRQLHASELVQFVLPGTLVAALLVRNEWTHPAGASRARFAMLARLLAPFLGGLLLPVVMFLVPYARSGALGAFVHGVFVLPMRRFSGASAPAPPLSTMLALIPFAILVAWGYRAAKGIRRRETVLVGVALALVVYVSGSNEATYRTVWNAVRNLLPVDTIAGVVLLAHVRTADARSPLLRERTMLLVAVTALCAMVQFPYSVANYFCYVAPLVALTMLALSSYAMPVTPTGTVPGLLVAFLAAFAVFRTNHTPIQSLGVAYQPQWPLESLALERAGIDVPVVHAVAYEALIPMLRAHARGGYTWASPDTPEIYFLSGLRNPTRALFEMFNDSTSADGRVLHALDAHGVTAIVLNSLPSFSPAITRGMSAQLASRYPHMQNIGPFQLRWRE